MNRKTPQSGAVINPNQTYDIRDVARLFRVSDLSIRTMIKNGQLPYSKLGNKYFWIGKSLLDWLENRPKIKEAAVLPQNKESKNA